MKKKLIALVCALALAVGLVGCSLSTPDSVGTIGEVDIPSGLYLLAQFDAYQTAADLASDDQDATKVSSFLKATITVDDATGETAVVSDYVAQKTLENRLAFGGGYTGWSRAWIISWWCRFGKGNLAYENLKKLLQDSTFDNLMDNHPYWNSRGKVFQIDGNFGAIAAICEMLVQSQNGKIVILPALGDTLSEGKISGLCVRGNGQIALEWKNGKLVLFKIKMKNKEKVILEYNNVTREYMLEKDREYIFDKNLIRINKENN